MAHASEYEVRCPRCGVSFPPETKKCVHCGARTRRDGAGGRAETSVTDRTELGSVFDRGRFSLSEHDMGAQARPRAFDAEPEEPEEAEGIGRGGVVRALVTLVWILLAVGFSLLRTCSDK